jgi:hypothetical protein
MTQDDNLGDLRRHAEDFAARKGFTYTVLADGDRVVGCVYIYPGKDGAPGAAGVRSWVRADRAELDVPLYDTVSAWLTESWPFTVIQYAPRAAT